MRFKTYLLIVTLGFTVWSCKTSEETAELAGSARSSSKPIQLRESLSDYNIQGDYRLILRAFQFRSTASAKNLLSKECRDAKGTVRALPEKYSSPASIQVALVCETGRSVTTERVDIYYHKTKWADQMYDGERLSTLNARNKCINLKGVPDEEKELDEYSSVVVCVHPKN